MSAAGSTIVPAATPPPGRTPNFDNPESISYQLIIVGVVFPVLALCFMLPRLYSAAFIIRKCHHDDYLIVVGYAIGLANAVICIVQATMGMGKHMWELRLESFMFTFKIGMIGGAMTYNLCTLFIKLSILSFYLRFSVERAFRMAVYLVMFVTIGYTLPNAFLFLYICRPMAYYWDRSIPGGMCINDQAAFDAANFLNMLTDYAILLLPIWMLQPLRRPLLKKIGITLVLMTGGFVCAISTMRAVTAKLGEGNPDISWHYSTNLIWCLVEEFVGVICACLPCLKAFAKRFFPNLFVFDPAFEARLNSSFFFSRGTLTVNNDNGSHGPAAAGGGQRAWWRRAAAAAAAAEGAQGGDKESAADKIGSTEKGMRSTESDVGGIGEGREQDAASAGASSGGKTLTAVEKV